MASPAGEFIEYGLAEQRRPASIALAIACYGAALCGTWIILLCILMPAPLFKPLLRHFIRSIAPRVLLCSADFSLAFVLVPPRPARRRWLPYLMSAVAGVITVAVTRPVTLSVAELGLFDFWPIKSFYHRGGHELLSSFSSSIAVLILYRVLSRQHILSLH